MLFDNIGSFGGVFGSIGEDIQDNTNQTGNQRKYSDTIPIVPLRSIVLFPGMSTPLSIGRKRSLNAVEEALMKDKSLGFITQKSKDIEEPTPNDIYSVGVLASIFRVLRSPDGSINLVVRSEKRFRIVEILQQEPFLKAKVEYLDMEIVRDNEVEVYVKTLKDMATSLLHLVTEVHPEVEFAIQSMEQPDLLAYFIASGVNATIDEKQKILEENNIKELLKAVINYIGRDLEIAKMSKEIQDKVKSDVEKSQREYFLRQQLKTIQKELGELSEQEKDIQELRERLEKKKMSEEARKVAAEQIERLSKIPVVSPEYTVTRNYVDLILDLPWNEYTEDNLDVEYAEKVLNEDHYDLEKVKKRILEYLSVMKLKGGSVKGPILCFYGPPGVGKTSLGRSIAKALGRKFIRISLGGVRDEAEIRGHRRTYVGALPGRIIQGIKKAGSSNPVFMLDEIDKLASDFRGDPASALLEVLDPEQNNSFSDHYLEIPYDLSRVLFITTANYLNNIPWPLLDRMEVISIPGYTEPEKKMIAINYIIPRQQKENGLENYNIKITDSALSKIINDYTKEAGVRELERNIGSVMRSIATNIVKNLIVYQDETIVVDNDKVREYLGPEKYISEVKEMTEIPGVAIGLAWTPVGGEILFIETTAMKGRGNLILTGSLGNVMKESASLAYSYIKSNAKELGIPPYIFKEYDLHIHIPSGAIPKDGPSAGITLLTSMVSLLTQRKVRENIAMTGELSLRGLVLPVGGIREKILAAKRYGINRILIPDKNSKDLDEIPEEQKRNLEIIPIKRVKEVLELSLEEKPVADVTKVFEKQPKEEDVSKHKKKSSKNIKVIQD
ncbi:MAG: endopeptidase La [Spirochaetia bacterium]|nr:endopeptidase La [Spirochaetota bacterium]MDW8112481.1 endopeptidase La [Spirochaetia bacterium]